MPKSYKHTCSYAALSCKLPFKLHLLPSLWSFNSGAKGLAVSDILVINSPKVYCSRHDPADGIDIICNINKNVTGNNNRLL
jgi:hypothetical protein